MNAGELIELLSRFPAGMPVRFEWEGVRGGVFDSEYGCWKSDDGVLVFDVDPHTQF